MNLCGGEHITPEQEDVIKSAIKWWRMHRPVGWDKKKHLQSPAVNISDHAGDGLAKAIATYYESLEKEGL
jgi:hypothetical protein